MYVYSADDTALVDAVKVLNLLSGNSAVTVDLNQDHSGNAIVEMEDALLYLQDQYDISNVSVYYYINDHPNSAQIIADQQGQVVWQGDFSPFGEVNEVVNQIENRFRFPGQILDSESGLYYNWHRFYDPETGRYISADPIGLAGGMNLYSYTDADPINYIDPWGLAKCTYSISKHTMTCVSNTADDPSFVGPDEQRQVGPDGVFSGQDECENKPECVDEGGKGPVVPGNYKMNKDNRPDHEDWYRLEPTPKVPGWKVKLGLKRGGFAYHLGYGSAGCINASKNNPNATEQFRRNQQLLDRENGSNTLTVTP